MDFDVFQTLGEAVEKEFRRFNYDDQSFPQIAESALTDWEPDLEFDLKGLGSFLLTTMIKQQPGLSFSNLPVTLFLERFVLSWVPVCTRKWSLWKSLVSVRYCLLARPEIAGSNISRRVMCV